MEKPTNPEILKMFEACRDSVDVTPNNQMAFLALYGILRAVDYMADEIREIRQHITKTP